MMERVLLTLVVSFDDVRATFEASLQVNEAQAGAASVDEALRVAARAVEARRSQRAPPRLEHP